MTTRNYKLGMSKLKDKLDTIPVYKMFKENYEENLLESTDVQNLGAKFYDINNTSVTSLSSFELRVFTKNNKVKLANLRITGLENNINQTEKEIKLKGFTLEEVKEE